ncbi:tRNA (5-methylaminomethyl-2-thiouridine)(34)-methyltransferase MnmD [Algicella marina]|uniref:tRNA (5-methylaminomethyl-2-thiouridine)(34)-methyltransferase MnmD n=1 Tax=Algicella marina TaxID=2683284 RepID=A0A6P1T454_9RHOB|nr:tRNA (5-methylaminomethyl-2-thiouridine)(34)-methyltransferase MnmD [Algicella marina]QHQ36039.1 tRNA (5-methylaminomethyl-2-thiouridine)(34)-methyltransferase MnmD [Algicella marina]
MNDHGSKHGTADLEWREGEVPISTRFDDPYYSLADGLEETRHVFLRGNDLPARFRDGFHIAELGFGTGLNALAALECWRASGVSGTLKFTSFEAYPLTHEDMARALAPFTSIADLAAPMLAGWGLGERRISLPRMELHIIAGDARDTLPVWPGQADAWFLDGFSPARNPELWEAQLLAEVANHTCPGGTCASYSAAGHVRQKLASAGFEVARVPGFGSKRHMTQGRLPR